MMSGSTVPRGGVVFPDSDATAIVDRRFPARNPQSALSAAYSRRLSVWLASSVTAPSSGEISDMAP